MTPGSQLDYFYSVHVGDYEESREWVVAPHRIVFNSVDALNYRIFDHWRVIPDNAYLYTSAITDCVVGSTIAKAGLKKIKRCVCLKVQAPQLGVGDELRLVGADPVLGAWKERKALKMVRQNVNEWIVCIDAASLASSKMEFKFLIENASKEYSPLWENCNNRTIELPVMEEGDTVVYELDEAYFTLPPVRVAGTLVPVFSLRSKDSFGIGDFGDLKKMIDWVSLTKQRLLQILPINDTTITHTWTDSYPYSCISIFALHPQYVDLTKLPELADKSQRERFEALRKELNALPQIDYERVNAAKEEYLKLIYKQVGKTVIASRDFKNFFVENEEWLVPYAQYCYLRDKNGTADFSKWPDHQQWDEAERQPLSSPRNKAYKDVEFYYFVQFILSSQLKAVHDYATSRRVILKGDIPIGVNRYGCDVWTEPRYFNLNGQAGAPPDGFSANGQNWGFPTYNWDEMIKDGCRWWVRRFQNMSNYFDAYRIDHVLGFFRIWEIPVHSVHGLLGQFAPALGMSREEIEATACTGRKNFSPNRSSPTGCWTAFSRNMPTRCATLISSTIGATATACVPNTTHSARWRLLLRDTTRRKTFGFAMDCMRSSAMYSSFATIKTPIASTPASPFRWISFTKASTTVTRRYSTACTTIISTAATISSGIRRR